MYYKEQERIDSMKKLLERFAYISIGSDFLIAISTYLVIQNIRYSNSVLLITDYLTLLEVVIASVIVVLIVSLSHYNRIVSRLNLMIMRSRHKRTLNHRINAFIRVINPF